MRESVPVVFVFAFGVGNRFSIGSSSFMTHFSTNFHVNDEFFSDRHL